MPQASDELRQKMKDRFGEDWLDAGPVGFLKSRGYRLTREWTWEKDGLASVDDVPADEWDCIDFMFQEWDYGGLAMAAIAKAGGQP